MKYEDTEAIFKAYGDVIVTLDGDEGAKDAKGNTITMNNPNTIQQTTPSTTTSQSNPYGTPDPTAEYPQEIYKIDRKSAENRAVVQFELAAAFDLANIRIPLRVCTKELFPSIGTFMP